MSEEWSGWFLHDGRGCPCVGEWVHRIYDRPGFDGQDGVTKSEKIGRVKNANSRSWCWSYGFAHVIRYRIRKPKGLTILEGLLENLPERETA